MRTEHGARTGREPGQRGALTNDRQHDHTPLQSPLAALSEPSLRFLLRHLNQQFTRSSVADYAEVSASLREVRRELDRRTSERDAKRKERERDALAALAKARAQRSAVQP